MDGVRIIVTHVSPELRAALVRAAREQNVSVNEAAVAPLAAAYGVEREASDVRFVSVTERDTMTLRIPNALRKKLRARAARADATIAGLVKTCLHEHYELPPVSPKRRARS